MGGRGIPPQKSVVDEQELIRVAVFNLERAAERILTLAGEVEAETIDSHLRGLSKTIAASARALRSRYPRRAPRRARE